MKGLMLCVLATAWVLEAVWLRGIRRHPYERPGHIDRDFRKMVRWVHPGRSKESTAVSELIGECPVHGPYCSRRQRAGVTVHNGPPTRGRGRRMCPVHGWRCLGGHK